MLIESCNNLIFEDKTLEVSLLLCLFNHIIILGSPLGPIN